MANGSDPLIQLSDDGPKFAGLILILFSVLCILYYIFLIYYWGSIEKILLMFENSSTVLTVYYSKIIDLFFYHPVFTDLAVIIAFSSAILYIILTLEYRGHMIFSPERKNIYEQNALAIFFVLALFNAFFIIPYCYFLIADVHRPLEAGLNLLMFLLSYLFVLLLTEFVKMMHNYKQLDDFCKELWPKRVIYPDSKRSNLAILITNKQQFRNVVTLLMIVSIFLSYFWNLNLLTLAYIESILLMWMITIFVLTFPYGPVKGPVYVHLNTGRIFDRVFIIEESELGHILVLQEGNKIFKIMTNAIAIIEPYSVPDMEYR